MPGEVPEGWRTVMLGELASQEPYSCVGGPFGSNLTTKDYVAEPGVPVIRGGNVPEDGPEFVDKGFVYVSHEKADLLRKNMAYPGDLIFTQRGTLGQIGLIPSNARHQRYVVSQSQMKLRPNSTLVSSEFLFQYFRSPVGKKMVLDSAIATGVPHINLGILKAFALSLPPLREQQKIAEILTSVDDAIQATEAVIEQTKKVKQGVMNRLLTKGISHTRFKQTEIGEIPEGWEVVRLEELMSRVDSGWSPNCAKEPAPENEWGVLKTSAVTWDGFDSAENKRLPDNLTPKPSMEVRAGDVLITRAGPKDRTGVVAFVRSVRSKLMLSDKIIRLSTDPHAADPEFLSYLLSSPHGQGQLMKKKSGMAESQTNISQAIVRETLVAAPPVGEQVKIVEVLSSGDACHQKLQQERDGLMTTKSALMTDLLTGRKRVLV